MSSYDFGSYAFSGIKKGVVGDYIHLTWNHENKRVSAKLAFRYPRYIEKIGGPPIPPQDWDRVIKTAFQIKIDHNKGQLSL